MTYVILHGTLDNIEGRMDDGALLCSIGNGSIRETFDYRESFRKLSEGALKLGNYYSDKEDTVKWNDRRRRFVSRRWMELIDIVEDQLKKRGRIDMDIVDFFNPDSSPTTDFTDIVERYLDRIRKDISNGNIGFDKIIHMMDHIGE